MTMTTIPAAALSDAKLREIRLTSNVIDPIARKLHTRGVLEHPLHSVRKWRADAAWPDYMVALEVEGGLYPMLRRRRDGSEYVTTGRHNTAKGYRLDMEKYNEIAITGWVLVRVEWSDVDSGRATELVRRAIVARRGWNAGA